MAQIDAYLYPRDITEFCQFDDLEFWAIKRVRDIFIADKNIHVYLCELTPSVYLQHVYTEIEFEDWVYDDEYETLRDHLRDKFEQWSEDTYTHVASLERAIKNGTAKHAGTVEFKIDYDWVDAGTPDCETDEYREAWESLVEAERCSPTFC